MDLFSYRTSFQGEEVKDYLLLSLERYATPRSSLAALFCSLSEKQLPFGQGRSVGEYLFFVCQFLDVSGFRSEFLILSQQKHLKILLVQVILLFKDKKKSTMLLLSNPPFI